MSIWPKHGDCPLVARDHLYLTIANATTFPLTLNKWATQQVLGLAPGTTLPLTLALREMLRYDKVRVEATAEPGKTQILDGPAWVYFLGVQSVGPGTERGPYFLTVVFWEASDLRPSGTQPLPTEQYPWITTEGLLGVFGLGNVSGNNSVSINGVALTAEKLGELSTEDTPMASDDPALAARGALVTITALGAPCSTPAVNVCDGKLDAALWQGGADTFPGLHPPGEPCGAGPYMVPFWVVTGVLLLLLLLLAIQSLFRRRTRPGLPPSSP